MMLRTLVMVCILAVAFPASAELIDFETDGNGDPSGASFPSAEYAAQGVTIVDSDPAAGSTFLNDTNPLNVGTAIMGKYVNVGGFDDDTFIELNFSPGITNLGFNWATGASADSVSVSLFGVGDAPLGAFVDPDDTTFINDAGFTVPAGTFSGAAGGATILRVLIEDQPEGTRVLILDNLRFTQVPEPASAVLLTLGLVVGCGSRILPRKSGLFFLGAGRYSFSSPPSRTPAATTRRRACSPAAFR